MASRSNSNESVNQLANAGSLSENSDNGNMTGENEAKINSKKKKCKKRKNTRALSSNSSSSNGGVTKVKDSDEQIIARISERFKIQFDDKVREIEIDYQEKLKNVMINYQAMEKQVGELNYELELWRNGINVVDDGGEIAAGSVIDINNGADLHNDKELGVQSGSQEVSGKFNGGNFYAGCGGGFRVPSSSTTNSMDVTCHQIDYNSIDSKASNTNTGDGGGSCVPSSIANSLDVTSQRIDHKSIDNNASNFNNNLGNPSKSNVSEKKDYTLNINAKKAKKKVIGSNVGSGGNKESSEKTILAKPPPISIYNKSIKEITTVIKANIGNNNFKINIVNSNLTKISLSSSAEHETIITALKANQFNFFTFTPKEKKNISVFVKGLPSDYESDEIKSAFDELKLNLNIVRIIKLKNNKWIIQFHNSSDISELNKIKYILNCRIYFEDVKKTRLIQCHKCQRYNHTAGNCNMAFRCIKCPNTHAPGECEIPKKEENNKIFKITDPATGDTSDRVGMPVFCVNCKKEGHVANASICEVRVKLINKLKEARERKLSAGLNTQSGNPNINILTNSPNKNSQGTYASQFYKTNSSPNSPVNQNGIPPLNLSNANTASIFNDCLQYFGLNFIQIIEKIKNFAFSYEKISDQSKRAAALFNFMISLTIHE